MPESCTCDVRKPRYEHATGPSIIGYAVRVSEIHDDTLFDPACPFHGDDGSMVARVLPR